MRTLLRLLPLLPLLVACRQKDKPLADSAPTRAPLAQTGAASASADADQPSANTPSKEHPPSQLSLQVDAIGGAERLLPTEKERVRSCFLEGASAEGAVPEGRVAFTITVDETGAVSKVAVTKMGGASQRTAACVRDVLLDVTFDAPAGGATTIAGRYTWLQINPGK